MKYYDPKFIKGYIETHKDEIKEVEVGMREDWSWTSETIYENGEYLESLDGDQLRVAGIIGSTWATPIMRVRLNEGWTEIINCYKDDLVKEKPEHITMMKTFARATGGMDEVEG